jgi:membrane associated rhomboid family serine protease
LSTSVQANLFNQYGVVPAQIIQGENLFSLLTSMFLHGGWLHLIGNMLFLWVFGDIIEAILGHIGGFALGLLGGFIFRSNANRIALSSG